MENNIFLQNKSVSELQTFLNARRVLSKDLQKPDAINLYTEANKTGFVDLKLCSEDWVRVIGDKLIVTGDKLIVIGDKLIESFTSIPNLQM